MPEIIGELSDLSGNLLCFSYNDKELLLKNDRSILQQIDYLFPSTKLVCDYWRSRKDLDIQVVKPLTRNPKYNHYIILVYLWERQEVLMVIYGSHTVYPPVYDRDFNFGPDYIDILNIQHYLNNHIFPKYNVPLIELDDKLEGKSFNCSTDTPEEIERKLANNESYNILCLKAESVPDKCKLISVRHY